MLNRVVQVKMEVPNLCLRSMHFRGSCSFAKMEDVGGVPGALDVLLVVMMIVADTGFSPICTIQNATVPACF